MPSTSPERRSHAASLTALPRDRPVIFRIVPFVAREWCVDLASSRLTIGSMAGDTEIC